MRSELLRDAASCVAQVKAKLQAARSRHRLCWSVALGQTARCGSTYATRDPAAILAAPVELVLPEILQGTLTLSNQTSNCEVSPNRIAFEAGSPTTPMPPCPTGREIDVERHRGSDAGTLGPRTGSPEQNSPAHDALPIYQDRLRAPGDTAPASDLSQPDAKSGQASTSCPR